MQETKQTTLYRIALAISLAFFLHVMLVLAAGSWWQATLEPEREARTIRVQIAPSGTHAPETTTASNADSSASANRESRSEGNGVPPVVTRNQSSHSAPIQVPSETRNPGRPDVSATSAEAGSERSMSSLQKLFGSASPQEKEPDADAEITRLSHEEMQKLSDYELRLWERIAQAVRYQEALAQLRQERSLTLTLHIMENGTLRRARITASSGSDALDRIGRQAALSANPYPKPPESSGPFKVRLVFLPES